MATKTKSESRAAAVRRLTEEMLNLEQSIDKQPTGPKRLELLREQDAGLTERSRPRYSCGVTVGHRVRRKQCFSRPQSLP